MSKSKPTKPEPAVEEKAEASAPVQDAPVQDAPVLDVESKPAGAGDTVKILATGDTVAVRFAKGAGRIKTVDGAEHALGEYEIVDVG